MVPSPPPRAVTEALRRVGRGEPGARDDLLRVVLDELRVLAGQAMRRERANHTLAPTALVNEAWLKIDAVATPSFEDRVHFFGAAARAMRQVLVDHARKRAALRHGGDRTRVSLTFAEPADGREVDLLELDDALSSLAQVDERRARVVELRFFAGLSVDETALALGCSPRTVKGDWHVARMFLRDTLAE